MKKFYLISFLFLASCSLSQKEKEEIVRDTTERVSISVKSDIYNEAGPIIEQTSLEVLELELEKKEESSKLISERSVNKMQDKVVEELKKIEEKVDPIVEEEGKEKKKCKWMGALSLVIQNILVIGAAALKG